MSAAPLPQFGLGGAGLGNLYREVEEADAVAAVHTALEAGVTLIDTAPFYGHGRSEARIGAALRAWRGARPMLSSKVGRVLDPVATEDAGDFGFANPLPFRPRFDYARDAVRRGLEASFARLGVERLDIALVHDIGRRTHGAAHGAIIRLVLDETLPTLEAARAEGLIDRIGIGVNEWEVCVELLERAPLDCILLAGRHTLLEQPALAAGMLDLCAAKGVAVLAAGVFNSGLLATRPNAASTYDYEPAPPQIVARAQQAWAICEDFGVAPQAAALQFPLAHPAVATAIVGARDAGEVRDLVAWRDASIPDELWPALKAAGLVHPDAPVPARKRS